MSSLDAYLPVRAIAAAFLMTGGRRVISPGNDSFDLLHRIAYPVPVLAADGVAHRLVLFPGVHDITGIDREVVIGFDEHGVEDILQELGLELVLFIGKLVIEGGGCAVAKEEYLIEYPTNALLRGTEVDILFLPGNTQSFSQVFGLEGFFLMDFPTE